MSQPPRSGLDPTFDVDAAPRVAGNTSLWPIVFGIVGSLGLGTVVFLQLNANRQSVEQARLTDPVAAAPMSTQGVPPAPDMSQYTQPAPEPVLIPDPAPEPILVQAPPPPVAPGVTQAELDRLRAPALIVDLGEYKAPAVSAQTVGPDGKPLDPAALAALATAAGQQGAGLAKNEDDAFASRMGVGGSSSKPARATHMGNLSTTIVQGEIVPAVLETAINSDVPGYARAMVSRDIRGFDGSKVLIPRGSRLIGQYKSGVALGQSRAFLIWERLIRPDGVTIDLGSPATDGLGQGGLPGSVDNHFFQRFGGAILLSLLNIGASAVSDSADTTVVIAGAQQGLGAVSEAFSSRDIKPTVTVPQGTPVRVFVSQDLDFTAVGAAKPVGAPN